MTAPSAVEAKIAAAVADDERRAARDRYRAAGGSVRRPLKSFTTTDDRQAARVEHAANLKDATDALATSAGFRDWVGSMILNPGLSPLNAALVAERAPGRIVNTSARWNRAGYKVAKGERAWIRVTAPGFKPTACFTAEQVGATDITAAIEADPPRLPTDERLDAMRDALSARLSGEAKVSGLITLWANETRESGALDAGEGAPVVGERETVSDVIPF